MASNVTITKVDSSTLQVKLGKPVPGLSKMAKGAKLPPEYLHAILNFHVANQHAGKAGEKNADKMRQYW